MRIILSKQTSLNRVELEHSGTHFRLDFPFAVVGQHAPGHDELTWQNSWKKYQPQHWCSLIVRATIGDKVKFVTLLTAKLAID